MRTSKVVASAALMGLALGLSPAASFDGSSTPGGATVAVPLTGRDAPAGPDGRATALPAVPIAPPEGARPSTPLDALRSGAQDLRAGHTAQALGELEYAAAQGVAAAQWKLGRMYADGDGVEKNSLRAFEYFSRLTKQHGDDAPGTPQARYVANAFVELGQYYLEGIPNTPVKADPERAREMYWYAASYFADGDAQYYLGRLYLDHNGSERDPRQAAKWLGLAAKKGQPQAQALLGAMLFRGDGIARQAALGLFWLTLAKDSAEPHEAWINESYASAVAQATDDERAMAYNYLESWLRGRRE